MQPIGFSATHRKALSRIGARIASVASIVAVSAAVVPPGVASAVGVDAFEVWNLTARNVTIYGYDEGYRAINKSMPAAPYVIAPGMSAQFGLDWRFDDRVIPRFHNIDPDMMVDWKVDLEPNKAANLRLTCSKVTGAGACSPKIGPGQNVVALWDAPRTYVTYDAGKGQQRAEVLNNLCTNGFATALSITCDYADMNGISDHTPKHMPTGYGPVTAENIPVTTKAKWKDKVTTTSSFTAEVSPGVAKKIFEIVNAGLTLAKKKTVEEVHEFSQSVEITVTPGHKGYVCVAQPLIQYTGTLRVKTPNTTWVLPGVTVVTPDADGGPEYSGFEIPVAEVVPGDACARKKLTPLT